MINSYESDYITLGSSIISSGKSEVEEGIDILSLYNKVLDIDVWKSLPILKSSHVNTYSVIQEALTTLEKFKDCFDGNFDESCSYCSFIINENINVIIKCSGSSLYCTVHISSINFTRELPSSIFELYVYLCILARYTKTRPARITVLINRLYMYKTDIELFDQQKNNFMNIASGDIRSISYDFMKVINDNDKRILENDPILRIPNRKFEELSADIIKVSGYYSYPTVAYTGSLAEAMQEALTDNMTEKEDENNG